jgi:hypothetical protein
MQAATEACRIPASQEAAALAASFVWSGSSVIGPRDRLDLRQ